MHTSNVMYLTTGAISDPHEIAAWGLHATLQQGNHGPRCTCVDPCGIFKIASSPTTFRDATKGKNVTPLCFPHIS